ncbi:MAG TPA: CHRD domain-containing protein [Vicinamibacterales bacterium]|jgi:hypothetical protein|nr:CHRD domain-containing protein [Vicinamibacterales bacterium]
MKRLSIVTVALSLIAVGCSSSSPATPTSPTKPTFTATLMPANEVPPVSNAESSGSGNVTITFDITRDAQNNITAGTATFVVNLNGYPAGTPVNIAHIHQAPAGTNGSIIFNTQLSAGDSTILTNGAGSFTKAGIPPSGGLPIMQQILDNPSGFYFNVHSNLNPGGFSRGQLVRVQ